MKINDTRATRTEVSLPGRVAIVTGGERNIGAAIAQGLMHAGASVVVNGLDPEAVESTASALRREGGTAVARAGDVSDPAQVNALVAQTLEAFGRLDVLVNNAADVNAGRGHFLDVDLAEWDRAIAVAGRGTLLCCQAAARHMASHGGGAIVNISSPGAQRGHAGAVAYDASKGAVDAATRSMAVDLAAHGIRVNAIAPGAIDTHRRASLSDEVRREQAAEVPLGRFGTGADIAAAAAFLASDAASYITGQVLAVDGGLLAQLRPPGAATQMTTLDTGRR